jgi:gas vesicle protein
MFEQREGRAMSNKSDKISDAASNVRPYVERALKDEELRDNVRHAFATAKDVYEELVSQGHVSKAATHAATDRDVQENLRKTVEELKNATVRLQGREEDTHKGRNTTLLLTGIALGILFNPTTGPQARAWLRETILGPNEEIQYDPSEDEVDTSGDGAA